MEAIADDRLYIWHPFFGIEGDNNELTILEACPLTSMISIASYPPRCDYKVLGAIRNKLYCLTDSIYPKWPCFMHSIIPSSDDDASYSAGRQEERRKDVTRAFVVLQGKFHIVARPGKLSMTVVMRSVMLCCVMFHNLATDEKRPLIFRG